MTPMFKIMRDSLIFTNNRVTFTDAYYKPNGTLTWINGGTNTISNNTYTKSFDSPQIKLPDQEGSTINGVPFVNGELI